MFQFFHSMKESGEHMTSALQWIKGEFVINFEISQYVRSQ